MTSVAAVAAATLIGLGVVIMATALWGNLANSPSEWPWYKALLHPNCWVERYGCRYVGGAALLIAGLLVLRLTS